MPSPVAHVAAGIALYIQLRSPEMEPARLLRTTILFSLLPDADSLPGLLSRDFSRFHNNISHSLGFAIAAGTLAGGLWGWRKGLFGRWFATGFLAYSFHLLLDYWSTRRGILLLWPLSKRRFASPTKLFYGLQWGLGAWNRAHLWTMLTEAFFSLILIMVVRQIKSGN